MDLTRLLNGFSVCLQMGPIPSKDMIFMKDVQCTETNEKSIFWIFQFFYFSSYNWFCSQFSNVFTDKMWSKIMLGRFCIQQGSIQFFYFVELWRNVPLTLNSEASVLNPKACEDQGRSPGGGVGCCAPNQNKKIYICLKK